MGYDVLQNGNPEEREVVNGTHDWEGWDFQGKKDTTAGRGGTSTGSWEQSICYFQSVVTCHSVTWQAYNEDLLY